MLAQKISNHLASLIKKSEAVKNQFIASKDEKDDQNDLSADPLSENKYTKVKGLIHKYSSRALILLTLNCASYCRFCTRQRYVSEIKKGIITDKDLFRMKNYLVSKPEIKEIILSGGDPFTVPETLIKALRVFSQLSQIKIIRIGTRVPVSDPKLVTKKLLRAFKSVEQPIYILIHFEHPDEITKETNEAILKLRKAGAILLSQTVFLKGINDSVKILTSLFSRLIEIGVKPYYLYRCDPVAGTKRFRVSFQKEVAIATQLRKSLSGLAYPLYIIDTPYGSGKIPVPLNFWQFTKTPYFDFLGKKTEVI